MKRETHEKFENISQSSGENWLHPTMAVGRSNSYFDCDISGAWLHIVGAKPLHLNGAANPERQRSERYSPCLY